MRWPVLPKNTSYSILPSFPPRCLTDVYFSRPYASWERETSENSTVNPTFHPQGQLDWQREREPNLTDPALDEQLLAEKLGVCNVA